MTVDEARAILRDHLDDTAGSDLDVDEYAAEAAGHLLDDDTDEVSEAIRTLTS